MKLTKFILPIAAILMVFAVVEAKAETCVYTDGSEYDIPSAIQYKGDNLEFIKFCCTELKVCNQGYTAREHYLLTHIAAMYNREAVLKYLVEDRGIPKDIFPAYLPSNTPKKTQIMMAAEKGGFESAKYLADNGANVIRKNNVDKNAYDYAVQSGNTKLAKYIKGFLDKALGYSAIRVEKNKKDLIRVLTLNDIKDEIRNFQRDIKFNGFFG